MVYNYNEIISIYKTNYNLQKALKNEELYRLQSGIYSYSKNCDYLEIIFKKYPNSILTSKSAYYYHGLSSAKPLLYYIGTRRNATRIKDKKVKQIFYTKLPFDDSDDFFNEYKVTSIYYCGIIIKIFSREMMLVEMFRNKDKMDSAYYNELLVNFKLVAEELDHFTVRSFMLKYFDYFTTRKYLGQIFSDYESSILDDKLFK